MRLIMESRHFFSCIEVMDLFYSMGYVVYDVTRSNINVEKAPITYSYTLETSQETGKRILHELPEKATNMPPVSVRVDRKRRTTRRFAQPMLLERNLAKA